MRSSAATLGALAIAACVASLWGAGPSAEPYQVALPGYHYQFPRDHFDHPAYQTEWWYYTGNLHTSDGRRFGFELTFFRQGVNRNAGQSAQPEAVWDVRDVWMAHLALSDIGGKQFLHTERLNRAGAGLAGASLDQARVWNGNWQARWTGPASQQLDAIAPRFSFHLDLKSAKPPVIHGKDGVSQKAAGEGHASHYISLTRLDTSGTLDLDGTRFTVEGSSWMDHEFFTHQLAADQIGWDWFSLQLNDGSEFMLFRLRHKDGSFDPYSAGTYIDPQGRTKNLSVSDFSLDPGKTWTSPQTKARYPIEWTIRVPPLGFEARITSPLPQQELSGGIGTLPPYWEGAIDVIGTKQNRSATGVGYLEMTGYTGRPPL
jgi:predicted secreted hydrolase